MSVKTFYKTEDNLYILEWYICKDCKKEYQTSPPSYLLIENMNNGLCFECQEKYQNYYDRK